MHSQLEAIGWICRESNLRLLALSKGGGGGGGGASVQWWVNVCLYMCVELELRKLLLMQVVEICFESLKRTLGHLI